MISKNGKVVKDRWNSHLHCDSETIEVIISNLTVEDVDFKKYSIKASIKGLCYCVEASEDEVYYKQRPKRKGLSRMTHKSPVETDNFVLCLKYDKIEDVFVLITGYFGDMGEPEPWDEAAFNHDPRGYEDAKKASQVYWSKKALIDH